jgi:hypothetical protein
VFASRYATPVVRRRHPVCAARARWAQYSGAEQAKLARHVELVRIQLALPLVWLGYEAATLTL